MCRTKVDESVMLSLVFLNVSLSWLHCCLSVTHAKNRDSIAMGSYSKSDTIAKNSDSITTDHCSHFLSCTWWRNIKGDIILRRKKLEHLATHLTP